jgi:L-aminopeptidase/D-esterase-like protein
VTDCTRREFGQTIAGGAAAMARGQGAAAQAPGAAAGSLTDVPGVRVGHATDARRPTGCTAILFDPAAAAGVDYDGSAPGESQVVLLQPVSPVERIHALFLTGGGVLALPASGGVLRFLEERQVGFDWGTPGLRIPIVVGAVIDDLALGDPRIRPDATAAYNACAAASTARVAEGNVGAGAGATVGKMHRQRGLSGMKGGVGTASLTLGDVVIGALAVVNAAGDVLDWRTGRIVAGARRPDGSFADSVDVMRSIVAGPPGAGAPPPLQPRRGSPERQRRDGGALDDPALGSTTLAVVATNVELTKTALTKLAMMATCGAARAIRPFHTTGDGDQLFAVSTARLQRPDVPLTALGALAADVIAEAIVRGVRAARGVEGWPGLGDL